MMMALQQGGIVVHHGTTCILWIRSVDYILATPLLLLDLGLLAGAAADDLFLIITCDIVMIATGYWCVVRANAQMGAAQAQRPHPQHPLTRATPPLHPRLPGPLWPPTWLPSGASSSFQWWSFAPFSSRC